MSAITAVKSRGFKRPGSFTTVVDKHLDEGVYSLAKVVGWINGKTYKAARWLEKAYDRFQKCMSPVLCIFSIRSDSSTTHIGSYSAFVSGFRSS